MQASTRALAIAAVTSLFVLIGCQQRPPQGYTGGRIDPYRSTPAGQFDPGVNPVTLLEFADQASQDLAVRLASTLQTRGHAYKVVLEMGGIENTTNTPTNDFRTIRRRIFLNLLNNQALTNQADIVEAVERLDQQQERLAPADQQGTTSARYDPNLTYLLEGTFGELNRGRGAESTYIFDVTVTHLGSRQIIFANQFEAKQAR